MSVRLMAGWMGVFLCLTAVPVVSQTTNKEMVLGFTTDVEATNHISVLREKPATFDSFSDRLDFIHDNFQLSMQKHVELLDQAMMDDTIEKVETPPTRLRLTPYIVVKQDSGTKVSLEPDFEIEVDLPNLERHWKVFLESSRSDELPGIDPAEREQNAQIGIRSSRKYIHTDVGVKFSWPPVVFARAEWRPDWSVEHTVLRPKQRIYYESDDGFGSLTSFTVHRWFGANNDMFWQSISAAKYNTKKTDGVELEQTLKVAWIRQALEAKWNWKRVLNTEDIARGHILRYSVFGHVSSEEEQVDRHRFTYTFRKPLYKHWIYLELAPGVEFRQEDDWDIGPLFTIGVDMLFWGTYER